MILSFINRNFWRNTYEKVFKNTSQGVEVDSYYPAHHYHTILDSEVHWTED